MLHLSCWISVGRTETPVLFHQKCSLGRERNRDSRPITWERLYFSTPENVVSAISREISAAILSMSEELAYYRSCAKKP